MEFRRTLLASAATAGLLTAVVASPASAHVIVEPSTTDAGAYNVLTFAASHGCEGSPTTSFTINLPDSITDAKPTVYPGWEVEKIQEELDEPVTTEDGVTITKHVGQIVYTAQDPLEDGYRMAFEVQVKNPDSVGETLSFPTLQTCEEGQTDWAQIPAEGQDPHELEAPAPSYTVTEASDEGDHHGEGTDVSAASNDSPQTAETAGDSASQVPGYLGLAAGVLGLILGGLALLRTRTIARK